MVSVPWFTSVLPPGKGIPTLLQLITGRGNPSAWQTAWKMLRCIGVAGEGGTFVKTGRPDREDKYWKWYVKQRIENNCEHLDNEASILLLVQIIVSETKMNLKKTKQTNKQKKRKKEKRKWKQKGKNYQQISNKGVTQSTPFIDINIFITKQLSMKNPEVSIILWAYLEQINYKWLQTIQECSWRDMCTAQHRCSSDS